MQLSEVKKEDGIHLAHIINGLRIATYPGLTGKDVDSLYLAKQWLNEVAISMAKQLQKVAPVQASGSPPQASSSEGTAGFKIKAMGPIGKPNKKKK